jgi:hypothetical protein
MAKEKSLVEDALLQMRNLEEAVSQNAKGILASTMKQEIKELVKESIVSEQDDDDEEIDAEVDMDMDSDEEEMDMDIDMDSDEEEMDMDMDIDSDDDEMEMDADMDMGDDEVIDLSDEDSISDEELLKVFMAMGEKDGIIVKKDDDQIHLTDENKDSEYLIQMGESEEEEYEMYNEMGESDDEEIYDEMGESDEMEDILNKVFDESESVDEDNQVVYEIEMDSDDEDEMEDPYGEDEIDFDVDLDEEEMDFDVHESMKPKIGKGSKIGKPSKFSYKSSKGGFKETMKTGTKGVGMGKVKSTIFNKPVKKETKEGAMMGKEETKESSRTLGNGKFFRKGSLPKPRAHSGANISIEEQRNINQVQILREKNEEYRKALNVFRDKLNEVAIFNSNLAYATRLFTEHSTSKQEKINILRRFDGVETIKESKNLYKTIKEELSTKTKGSITESIETRIEKTPTSGSASTLIESKTYENPQFLRMKDLMSKIK